MADGTKINFDTSSLEKAFAKLDQNVKEHLARSGALAGGKVIRDEAKLRVPVDKGTLRDSIYVAFSERDSDSKQKTYTVSWNSKKAPHGHLVENGFWLTKKGKHKKGAGGKIKRIPGKAFLASANEAVKDKAARAANNRMRERYKELVNK